MGALHPQVVELGFDGARKLFTRGPPRRGELLTHLPDAAQQRVFFLLQLGDALAGVRQSLALGLRFRGVSQHVLNRRAVFALEVLDEFESFLDRVQPLGVELDPVAVIAEVAGQVAKLLAQR